MPLSESSIFGKSRDWGTPRAFEVPGDEADVPFTVGVAGESGFPVPTARGVINVYDPSSHSIWHFAKHQ